MNEAIKDLIGEHVQIESLSAQSRYTDNGLLEAFEHPWLRLRKDNGEILCLCVYHVRLLKKTA